MKIYKGNNLLKLGESKKVSFNSNMKQLNFLDSRVYQRSEDKFYPSVTTILQYFPKDKFFETWIKDVGHNADIIMRRAGEEGSQVHSAIEQLIEGQELSWIDEYGNARYNQNVWEMILKFADFWETYKPVCIATESSLYSDNYEYAGTVDLVCMIGDERWLIDFKTSNSLHDSYNLQVAAYVKAWEELGRDPIQKAGILWLKSAKRGSSPKKEKIQGNGWEIKEITDVKKSFESFEIILKLYRIINPIIEPSYKNYPITLKL